MYQCGKVKKASGSKIAITIYSWSGCEFWKKCRFSNFQGPRGIMARTLMTWGVINHIPQEIREWNTVLWENGDLEAKCNQKSGLLWTFCGDNSSLKFLTKFRKKNLVFLSSFCATFQCGRYNVFKKKWTFFCSPPPKKNCPQKLLIIPLDQKFSFQQVFALWNRDSFKGLNFLFFKVIKLCRMKKYLRISMMQVQ